MVTPVSGLFFTEQRFEETAKQNNPYLLRVGALKIYCERKQTAKAVFFTEQRFEKASFAV